MNSFLDLFRKLIERIRSFIQRLLGSLGGGPPSVRDWLDSHPAIAECVKWQFAYGGSGYDVAESAKKSWNSWTEEEKQNLVQAFEEAWQWYISQSDPFHNLQDNIQYPPNNRGPNVNDDTKFPIVVIDEEYAWQLYIRWIAQNLLQEIGNHFPWSLLDYNAEQLQILFDSAAIMTRLTTGNYNLCGADHRHSNYVKRKDNLGRSLPAPPRYTYSFLSNNNLIGQTRHETIASLLQWASENLAHFIGDYFYGNMMAHWQYRGLAPITKIIEGTTYSGNGEFDHWTAGCHGTLGFLRNVLRAANIPVQGVRICGHALVYFITEDLYLDHADAIYNSAFKALGLPASDLLIDGATYLDRFGPNLDNHDENCEYINYQIEVLSSE